VVGQYIAETYRRIKKYLILLDLTALAIFYYGERFMSDSLRNAILPATIIGAAALFFESIISLSEAQSKSESGNEYPDDVMGFGPRVRELLDDGSKKHEIHMIVNTGGSTMTTFLRDVLANHSYALRIHLRMFDPRSPYSSLVPPHWPDRVRQNIQRIDAMKRQKCQIDYRLFDWPPCISGIMVDQRHLFIGFCTWDAQTGRIADKRDHHTYMERSASTEHWFKLFLSWAEEAPQRRIALPVEASAI